MAFNAYISLGPSGSTKQYKVVATEGYRPQRKKVVSTRLTLTGKTDSTFGQVSPKTWEYRLKVPYTDASLGTIANLRTAYDTHTTLAFSDFDGTEYTVVWEGEYQEETMKSVLDDDNSKYFVTIHLTEVLS